MEMENRLVVARGKWEQRGKCLWLQQSLLWVPVAMELLCNLAALMPTSWVGYHATVLQEVTPGRNYENYTGDLSVIFSKTTWDTTIISKFLKKCN